MRDREILIGVCAGIAAYKTAALVSQLAQAGAAVSVIMTESARQFIGATTFQALTGRPVSHDMFGDPHHALGAHIELTQQAELLCVAPATANFLAKAAHGIADDLLSTALLAFNGPVLLVPAMNTQMWQKRAVQRNVSQLQRDGYHVLSPEEGWLSCRQQGPGRMPGPEVIASEIGKLLLEPEADI